jgi:hypothetical protein
VTESRESTMTNLASDLFDSLERMDRECPTGLCDYATHLSFNSRRHEAACCTDLRRHLAQRGYNVDPKEKLYPTAPSARGPKCDLFLTTSANDRVWIEVKVAWRQWFYEVVKRNADGIYRPYFYGPLSGGWEKTHSVLQDLQKLEAVTKADADFVGELGIGFDSADLEIVADLARLGSEARLEQRGWNLMHQRVWDDARSSECRLTCWFWWRAL